MKRPIEADYISHVAYTRALEQYCDNLAQPEQDSDRFCDANCTWLEHHPNCKYGKPEHEPVGSLSVRYHRGCKSMTNTDFDYNGDLPEGDYELYTTPPKAQPLTEAQRLDIITNYFSHPGDITLAMHILTDFEQTSNAHKIGKQQ